MRFVSVPGTLYYFIRAKNFVTSTCKIKNMNKQLKKNVERKLVDSMEGILTGINAKASVETKKKIKEAGKMVAKKFLKVIDNNKIVLNGKQNHTGTKKVAQVPYQMPKRDAHGKFIKKKK